MSHSVAQIDRPAPARFAPAGLAWPAALMLAALALVWFQAVNHLRHEWEINPQYSYGWTVPFLALYLFGKRWSTRPAPAAPRGRWMAIWIALLCTLPLLPARIISVANPDWRLLSWFLALSAVLITFSALYLTGGLPWLRHFAFAVAFFLVATPWPAQFEQHVVQSLMRADASIVVETLNAIGTIAIQRGNVIELSTGLVGIEDACTGVRSLQSTFMIALFLGEFYRMSFGRRGVLVVAAAVLAFACNLVRTLILCLVASASGTQAVHTWHDSAGLGILLVCLVGLWLFSLWLTKGQPEPGAPIARDAVRVTRNPTFALLLLFWLLATEVGAATWYHVRGAQQALQPAWSVVWPEKAQEYQAAEVPQAAKDLLLYNEGGGATWTGAENHRWLMYYFRWLPGRTAAIFVKVHRPDVCLPASGLTMRAQSPLGVLSVHGVQLPYRTYRFESGRENLDVLYCYSDGRSSYTDDASAQSEDWSVQGRLRAAWKGQREVGARMLEVAVWGYEDENAARAALLRELDKLVTRQ